MSNAFASNEANSSPIIREEDLILRHPSLKEYTYTFLNQIAGQVSLATRGQQSSMGVGSYHVFSHPAEIFNKVAPTFVEIETEDPLGIKAAYDTYNEQQEPEFRLPEFKEMYGIIKFCIFIHDMGNGFELNPKIKELLEKDLDVFQFKKQVDRLGLEFKDLLIPLAEHTEKNAEDRSKVIGSFYLKYTVGANAISTAEDGSFSSINPDEYFNTVERFVHAFCEYTKFKPNGYINNEVEKMVGLMDRVLPYVGIGFSEKVDLIKRLCREKIDENSETQLSLLDAVNFPYKELVRILGITGAFNLIKYFEKVGIPQPLGNFVKPILDNKENKELLSKKMSWQSLLESLEQHNVIMLLNE